MARLVFEVVVYVDSVVCWALLVDIWPGLFRGIVRGGRDGEDVRFIKRKERHVRGFGRLIYQTTGGC